MAKKEKITLTRSEDFKDIDEELDRAMDRLEDTNVRIDEVLNEHDADAGSEAVGGGGDPAAAIGEEGEGEEEKAESSQDSA